MTIWTALLPTWRTWESLSEHKTSRNPTGDGNGI